MAADASAALSAVATQPPLASPSLSRFLRVPDPTLSICHDALWDLKHAIALQAVFVAGCCRRTLALGSARAAEASKKTATTAFPSELTVGIIGGGVIGGVVAHALLDAGLPPSSVLMSTRSPQRQKELSRRGASVIFDNALVASRAQLLIIAVLPGPQLHEVARTARPAAHTLVLCLVGATPLPKVRSLFGAPKALTSAADTTLPLIRAAQARSRLDAADAALALGALPRGVSGRLADSDVVQLAAEGLAPHVNAVSLSIEGLTTILADLELPPDVESDIAITALVGQLPPIAMSELRSELGANPAVATAAGATASGPALGAAADDDDDASAVESALVLRTLAAFRARLGHAETAETDEPLGGEEDEQAIKKPL